MPLVENATKKKLKAGGLALGFGVHHLRTAATGRCWPRRPATTGCSSTPSTARILGAGGDADLHRRAADRHHADRARLRRRARRGHPRARQRRARASSCRMSTPPKQAKRIAEAFHYPADGDRSWGGPPARSTATSRPPTPRRRPRSTREILIVAMIESPEGVANADAIAAVDGIDVLLIGTSDLTAEMGISGQIVHPRGRGSLPDASAPPAARHGKFLGMGGVYELDAMKKYIDLGAQFILTGSDHAYILAGANRSSSFLRKVEAERGKS